MGTTIRRAGRLASGATLAIAAVFALAVLVPSLWGWQRYAIVSGSMTGTYDRGTLVLDEVVPSSELRVGDVITYRPPAGAGPDHLITHRIAWIGRDGSGQTSYRTKGDANQAADPWTFRLGATQARVKAGIPHAGTVLTALSGRRGRMIAIALPALLIAAVSLVRLWRALGDEARRRTLAGAA
jgi:signal peptidase I